MTENSNRQLQAQPTVGSTAAADGSDLLLQQFFSAARSEQLPDNGFTRRVVSRLPLRQKRLSRLWTAACIAVGAVLFTLIGGWQQMANGIVDLLSASYTPAQLFHLMVCGAVLNTIAIAELMHRERLA